MRTWFVNRFYLPDASATSQLLADLVRDVETDREVAVITTRGLHDNPRAGLEPRELMGRSSVYRLWSTRFGRRSKWLRALDYLTFHASVAWFLLGRVRSGDVVVLKTDPPLLQLMNTSIIRFRGGKVINWIQDIYPEIAERSGMFPGPGWLVRLLRAWRDRALRKAAANVVISRRMGRFLESRKIGNVSVISNWADEESITPVPREDNPLRAEWGLADRFAVMFSGNFGRVHAFDEIRGAMAALSEHGGVRFVLVGDGAQRATVQAFVESNGLKNVAFYPFQPQTRLRYSLGLADVHLVSLRPGMEDLVMPSKLYGILAAGRSALFIGERDSAIADLIHRHDVGKAFVHGDGASLTEEIRNLAANREPVDRMQKNARELFENRFTRARCVVQWKELIARIGGEVTGWEGE
jgi:glycosyltransferase involved in cell wall biosynthesis